MENTLKYAAEELTKLFPKTTTVYSAGFERWLKMSNKAKKALVIAYNFNQQAAIESLQMQVVK